MSGQLRIKGEFSGYSQLEAPQEAGNQTFVFPTTGGELLVASPDLIVSGSGKFGNTISSGSSDFTGPYSFMSKDGIGLNANASTPKVSLLAGGRAWFAGKVISGGDPSGGNTGAVLKEVGTVSAGRPTGTSAVWEGLQGSNVTSQILADGSAAFDGNVKTGNGLFGVGDPGAQINADGMIASSRVESSTQDAFYVQVASDSSTQKTKVIHFQTDGSASFEGNVSAKDTLDVTNSTTNANSFVQRWFSDIPSANTQKAILLANGQLTLAGDGNQGAYVSAPTTASGGYKAYYAKSASAGVDTQYFLYGDDAGDVNTVRIATDGSADFLGEVTAQGRTLAETQSGTWTPTCNSGSLTFVAARCYWIRTGNLVVLNGSLSNFTNVSDGSEIVLSGYPYAAAQESYGSAFLSRAAAGTGSNVQVNACYVLSAGDGGGIKFIGSALDRGGGAWGLRYNNLSSTQEAYFQVSYMTDDTTWVPSS